MANLSKTFTERIKDADERFLAHLFQLVELASGVKENLLSKPPQEIEDWLNATPANELNDLFTDHATRGAAVNALCIASGVDWRVDVDSFTASATKKMLSISADADGWHVTAIQPEPEPTEP